MLKDVIREAARAAVQARFQLRDEVLIADLQKLAAQAETIAAGDDEMARISVRLRLACEHDLFERAQMIWLGLKRAHQEHGAPKSATLLDDLLAESHQLMKEAGLNLAARLEQFSTAFRPVIGSRGGLDARWLSNLCRRAMERYGADMEDYVLRVRGGFRSLVGR